MRQVNLIIIHLCQARVATSLAAPNQVPYLNDNKWTDTHTHIQIFINATGQYLNKQREYAPGVSVPNNPNGGMKLLVQ